MCTAGHTSTLVHRCTLDSRYIRCILLGILGTVVYMCALGKVCTVGHIGYKCIQMCTAGHTVYTGVQV